MSANSLSVPFPIFNDIDGDPLDAGYIYIGTVNLDPETNPISVYFDADLTVPAAQPIRTLNGFPSNSGAPARLYVNSDDYSITVRNKNSSLIYTSLASTERIPVSKITGQFASDQITFTQAGTGAATRTVESKLQDVISVLDYGATGDGSTDDTASIQACIDANIGKTIYLPQGTYRITSTLLQNTTGLGNTSVCKFVGDGMTQTKIDNQSGAATFKVTSGSGVEFAYNFALSDLSIISTTGTSGTIGVELVGCRFVELKHVEITGMGSHGVYGYSTIGDLTDTAHVNMTQVQIESCGGYGVYAKTDGNAIQYNWNMYECRIGSNTLGGLLLESLTNSEFKNCGVYYNAGFGLKVTTGTSGAPGPKLIVIEGCEFDTNEGVQIDLDTGHGHTVSSAYLIDNNLTPAFTKGIVIGTVQSSVINQVVPRMNASVTGKVIIEIEAAAVDIVIRDSDYQGWSASNGTFYVDNTSGEVTIDDRLNRFNQYTGSYTVEIKNTGKTATSPTTKTAFYSVNGDLVTVSFRGLNAIDTSVFASGDYIGPTLPFACKSADVAFSGSCILTTDSGTSGGYPVPVIANLGDLAVFYRMGSNALLTASNLTSGVSSLTQFTLSYLKE